jgi:hypothetical protein
MLVFLYQTTRNRNLEDRNRNEHGTLKMEAVDSSEMLLSAKLHGFTSQQAVVLTFTAVRTSNLTPLSRPNLTPLSRL